MAKKRIVVLYGGKADEHPISCISTAGVLKAMDTERFEPIPVGITKSGQWIVNGEDPRGWDLSGDALPEVKVTPQSRPVLLDVSRGCDGFPGRWRHRRIPRPYRCGAAGAARPVWRGRHHSGSA